MNETELKRLWKEHTNPSPSSVQERDAIRRMDASMRRLNHSLWWRDLREVIAGLVVIGCVSFQLSGNISRLGRIGDVIIIAGCVGIAAILLIARRRSRYRSAGLSVRDSMREELAGVSRQIWLLRNVIWWYVLPLCVGVALVEFGRPASMLVKGAVLMVLIAIGAIIHLLNQRAVRGLQHAKAELEKLLNAVPEWREASDETNEGGSV